MAPIRRPAPKSSWVGVTFHNGPLTIEKDIRCKHHIQLFMYLDWNLLVLQTNSDKYKYLNSALALENNKRSWNDSMIHSSSSGREGIGSTCLS